MRPSILWKCWKPHSVKQNNHLQGSCRASQFEKYAFYQVRSQLQRVPTQEEMEMIDVDEDKTRSFCAVLFLLGLLT